MTDSEKMESASEAQWQSECARRALLVHLGITPLVSRRDPIAARPAARLLTPLNADQVLTPISGDSGDMAADQLRALIRDSGDVQPEPQQTATLDSEVSEPPPVVTSVAAATRVSLLVVTTADIVWVETLEDQLLRQEQLQLIAAMARAIRGASVSSRHQQFDWPPAENSAVLQAGGFQDMLSGFMQRLVTDHASQHVIYLGPVDGMPALSLQTHGLPSSLDMLREPALKRQAWSVLKPLRLGI